MTDPTAPQPLTAEGVAAIKRVLRIAHLTENWRVHVLALIATVEQLQAEVDRLTADAARVRALQAKWRQACDLMAVYCRPETPHAERMRALYALLDLLTEAPDGE